MVIKKEKENKKTIAFYYLYNFFLMFISQTCIEVVLSN